MVLLLACSPKREEKKSPAPVPTRPAMPVAPAIATPVVVIDAAPAIDAAVVEGVYATSSERFLAGGYLHLLWLDHYLGEMLATYPGVPATNRYSSHMVKWEFPDLDKLEKALRRASATASHPMNNEVSDTDRAVGMYTKAALEVWPELRGLAEYYKSRQFVDDEFARGRREAPLVADAIAKIGPLRKPMVESVFAGWRLAAGDKKDSARAIAAASFEACTRAAYLVFDAHATARAKTRAKQANVPDPAMEAAIDEGMSACRKGVGAVSALPTGFQSFASSLREAAVAFGDASNAGWAVQYADDDLEELVSIYITEWPKLPSEPAEQPGER
jgi:hypothetical protein